LVAALPRLFFRVVRLAPHHATRGASGAHGARRGAPQVERQYFLRRAFGAPHPSGVSRTPQTILHGKIKVKKRQEYAFNRG